MGRAQETASFTARRLGLPIRTLDFMHEISWGGPGIPDAGHPWTLSDRMLAEEDIDLTTARWREHPYFARNTATACYDRICDEFDGFLAGLGFERRGFRYLCSRANGDTIALFSHGGSGACAIAYLLNLPFPYVATVMPYDFTSVTVLDIPGRQGAFVYPRLALFNDIAHTGTELSSPLFQQFLDDRTI